MELKSIVRIAIVTAALLCVPLVAMQLTHEVAWSLGDFVVAGALLFGAGLTYELIAQRRGGIVYRAAVGLAVATGLFLVWANLAVGLIGDEQNRANLMYLGVLGVGVAGAAIAQLKPRGMVRALLATALAQMLVAVIAQAAGLGFTFAQNGFFALLWLGSALLFQRSAREERRA